MSDISQVTLQSDAAASLAGESVEVEQDAAIAEEQGVEQPRETEAPTVEQETEQPEELSREQDIPEQYAQRYPFKSESLADPMVRQLLLDKINTDGYVEKLKQQAVPVAQSAPQEQGPTLDQHFARISSVVDQRTDPAVAKRFHGDFLRSFGVPDSEIAKIPAEQALTFTKTASTYVVNLMATYLDDFLSARLSEQISKAFPGFGDMYERNYHSAAWDRVRNSDAKFSNLPAYGSRGFAEALRKAAERIPGFDEMAFKDAQGKPLSAQESAERKYAMLAQSLSGGNLDPSLLQQAAAAGARNARRADVRRSAGNLGSGQSGSAMPAKNGRFQTNSDIFDDEAMEMHRMEHGKL